MTNFKQTSNGAKTVVAANALNNTTSPLTFSVQSGKGALFPQPGNGFYVTAYNSGTYSDPNDDPNMRIGLCTARSTDSLSVTWGQFGTPINAMSGTPDLRLLPVSQLFTDYSTAINAIEAAITNVNNTSDATKQLATLQAVYPVGSIYIATVSTNPNTLFGFGTWAPYAAGRTIIGVGTSDQPFAAAATGGESNHILLTSEMPSHTHTQNAHSHTYAWGEAAETTGGTNTAMINIAFDHSRATSSTTATNNNTGGDGSHNNLQPYVVCYLWQRTA